MNTHLPGFLKKMRSPIGSRLYLLLKLPSAYFAGVRIREVTEEACRVSVPFKWFTRNPFRSTYFACLSMAAELSTGALAMAQLYRLEPPVSMLVIRVESAYFKKATGRTVFTCLDGEQFRRAVEEAQQTGEARKVAARSVGKNREGETVAEFIITWSFKAKSTLT